MKGKTQIESSRSLEISDYGRRRLLTYADSFRELAKSMEEKPTGIPEPDSDDAMISPDEKDPERSTVLEARRLQENQQILCDNLNEMAQIMDRVASEVFRLRPLEEKKRKGIVHAFKGEGIIVTDIYYIDRPGERTSIGITMYSSAAAGRTVSGRANSVAQNSVGASCTGEQAADLLSVLLNNRMEVSVASPYLIDAEPRHFVFVEEAAYVVLSGTARAVKEGEEKSGDNYAIIESEKGKLTALLSDGMGSGEKASADSELILDLMEKMLEAGYPLTGALNLVNSTLVAKAEKQNMSTLDICDLDLYEGTCSFYKMGAAATFLKRDHIVEQIENHSLPLGIFQGTQPQVSSRKLMDGDYIIMMTDGVLDALGQNRYEETMRQIISSVKDQNPKEIARNILQFVLHCSGGHIQDDMTILVLGIWENT